MMRLLISFLPGPSDRLLRDRRYRVLCFFVGNACWNDIQSKFKVATSILGFESACNRVT